jgi:hypothetical protein
MLTGPEPDERILDVRIREDPTVRYVIGLNP